MIFDGYCTCGTQRDGLLSPSDLLKQMELANISRAIIAPEDHEIAVHNEAGNERVVRIAERSEGRLVAACTVSPWQGDSCMELLNRAIDGGARLLVLSPSQQGFNPCDELVDPLMHAAADKNLPVYFHTGPHSVGAPTQMMLLAMRHPHTRVILAHCGSTDYSWDMPAVLELGLPNVWFELSFVRPWAIPGYAKLSDESRLIFASGSPRNDLSFELEHANRHWPIADHPGTYRDNLQRLLSEVQS
jgi:predicted TIM-barrel fold metal-dependent hydrolase